MSVSINGSTPILGILDLSTGVSILNWEAAELLGMECEMEEEEEGGVEREGTAGDKAGSPGSTTAAPGSSAPKSSSTSSSSSTRRGPMYGAGYFGSIRVRPMEQLLLDRPAAGLVVPQPLHGSDPLHPHDSAADRWMSSSGSSSSSLPPQPPQIRLPAVAEETLLNGGSSSSSGSGASAGSSWQNPPPILPGVVGGGIGSSSSSGGKQQGKSPNSSSSKGNRNSSSSSRSSSPASLQVHELYEHELRIVLGAGSKGGGARVAPPSKLAVAHLKGLAQVGLAGRPAMVVGGDIWGRRRVVLCLNAGVMYL